MEIYDKEYPLELNAGVILARYEPSFIDRIIHQFNRNNSFLLGLKFGFRSKFA